MSCADVCISVDIDSAAEFYSESVRRAAKPYRCCECSAPIGKGERHEYVSGKWEGAVMDFRTCLPCAEIRKVFCCNAWLLETLWEDMREQVFPDWQDNELMAVDCLARLETDAAIAKVREMYAEYMRDRDS